MLIVEAAVVLAQLVALASLLRARGASPQRRRALARQTAIALALFLAVDVAVLAYDHHLAGAAVASDSVDPSQRAQILAQTLSEIMNGAAFAIAGAAFPAGVMIWLSRSAKKRSG